MIDGYRKIRNIQIRVILEDQSFARNAGSRNAPVWVQLFLRHIH
jgi:hypothetical protein